MAPGAQYSGLGAAGDSEQSGDVVGMLARVNVLAADDSAVSRELVSEALGRLGADATMVANGLLAVQALRHSQYDLVLMDCSMPVMDGFAATRLIRAEESERGSDPVPVVALTGVVAGVQDEWLKAGMNECLMKPFTLATLSACLQRWTGSPVVCREEDAWVGGRAFVGDLAEPGLPVLNAAVLDEIRAIEEPGDDLLLRVIALFREHAPSALDAVATFRDCGEPLRLGEAAHAMKSLCRNVGAERLASRLNAIEKAARLKSRPCRLEEIDALREELRLVLAALEAVAEAAQRVSSAERR